MGFALDGAKWPQVFRMMGEFDYRHEVTVDVLGKSLWDMHVNA
jgi:hypothetical protein